MKIMFFTMTMCKGGAERVISLLCNRWTRKNDEIFLVTCISSKNSYEMSENVKIFHLIDEEIYWKKGKARTFFPILNGYKKKINEIKPDVIISFLPEPCIISSIMRWRYKVPVIGSERGNPYYQYGRGMRKKIIEYFYRRLDGFVFQTEGAKEFFSARVTDGAVVIGNPLSPEKYVGRERVPCRNSIVSVGRFTTEKNYALLVDAFYQAQKVNPKIELYIYGRYQENDEVCERIRTYELVDKIHLCGEVDKILDHIQNAGVFVMSSISEGLPNALMEAMALGLPVISTDCPSGGPRKLIKPYENGLLIENNNVQELKDAILEVVGSSELADRIGTNAKNILSEYCLDKILSEWVLYIKKIVKESSEDSGEFI